MTPFFFGDRPRRLFGVYDPARTGGRTARAAVLCHPWGDEQIHAYRTVRQLAVRMSQTGFHALRFDYYGTGDSAGDTGEGDFANRCGDIVAAIAELKSMTGVSSVTLFGLRLGATLAAMTAAECSDEIDSLVLWDPLVGCNGLIDGSVTDENSVLERYGVPVSASLERDFARIDLSHLLSALPRRTLVLLTTRASQNDAFGSLTVERLPSASPWIEERAQTGSIPVNVLHRIVQWLE